MEIDFNETDLLKDVLNFKIGKNWRKDTDLKGWITQLSM